MDHVTLLAEDGSAIGTLPKSEVHTQDTPLHLAFSCYVLDDRGRVLVTRRALGKRTWPGVWTNSFCGHPRPDEDMLEAVARRAQEELGIRLTGIRLALPDYRYRAVDASGIVENEICPVHIAVVDGDLSADPDEVAEWAWVEVDDLVGAVTQTPFAFSPWLAEQLPRLRALGEV
ncbi:isopentenyl-diphosphate Delta-isomerase [Microbacterium sp. W4I20]|uniref:isopentenyl-diphosphate Delta-isomerase n=1 Tax=Microbacterium sp. W4I20 TaxID=3042262 RepID=UPI002783BC8E|nr:isopentenyl-diphosphate Delta-isomerase [Microbacterium sp. W4I20]MDQ0728699.1 isopentenyl-diphosphate delta-isomerase [Microbacterium sp. W4I20]